MRPPTTKGFAMPYHLPERPITHHLDRWLAAHPLSRRELAAQMRFSYDYISMVMDGRRSVTDGFLGRFVRTFGWQVAADVFDGIAPEDEYGAKP
jgi:hypothetical protein